MAGPAWVGTRTAPQAAAPATSAEIRHIHGEAMAAPPQLPRYPARMSDDFDERPAVYGTWDWPRVPHVDSAPVVRQALEEGCGAACAVMLLLDRGLEVSQEAFADGLEMPSEPGDLVARLNELSPPGLRWQGGSLPRAVLVNWNLIAEICQSRGTWAALLEPHGHRLPGHWVVVDGITDEGLVLIRDPVGVAYGMPLRDFAVLWGYTVLVLQEVQQ